MKKNSFIKSILSILALIASVGGVLFFFRDKISDFFKKFSTKKIEQPEEEEEVDKEEEDFEHAFDTEPSVERGYVSLHINSHQDTVEQ